MKRKFWITAALAGLAALVLAWFAYRYGARYCTAMKTANLLRDTKDKIAPLDCIEFWINRYQSAWAGILSTCAAIFAAVLAWRAVQAQIRLQARIAASEQVIMLEGRREQDKLAFARIQKVKIAILTLKEMVQKSPSSRKYIDAMERYKNAGNDNIPRLYMTELSPVMDLDDAIMRVESIFFRSRKTTNIEDAEKTLAHEMEALFAMLEPLDAEQNRITGRIRTASDQADALRRH